MKRYAASKIFARPPPPFGLRPSGGGGRAHMDLNPDKKNLEFLRMFQTETLPDIAAVQEASIAKS